MRYLLDTDICIYLIKGASDKVRQRLRKIAVGEVGISTVTLSELCYGVANSARPEQNHAALLQFIMTLDVLAYEAEAAEAYGRLRADLARKRKTVGSMDMMIAAHAIALDRTLVTNNVRAFSRIGALQLENWT
jgi:tRNA(fMet)-specific endonuclease VapC